MMEFNLLICVANRQSNRAFSNNIWFDKLPYTLILFDSNGRLYSEGKNRQWIRQRLGEKK